MIRVVAGASGFLIAAAFAVVAHAWAAPVKTDEIIRWSQADVPSREIIWRIADSGSVYYLSPSTVSELRSAGVPEEVIQYIHDTYLSAAPRRDGRPWVMEPSFEWRHRGRQANPQTENWADRDERKGLDRPRVFDPIPPNLR